MVSTIRIDSGYFWCAIVVNNGVVIETAPIVGYMKGWSSGRVRDYCLYKGWQCGKILGEFNV